MLVREWRPSFAYAGVTVGQAAVPGPFEPFQELDDAIEYNEMLPPLEESSDDEGPFEPPESENEDLHEVNKNTEYVFEYRGPKCNDPKTIDSNTASKEEFKDKPHFVSAVARRNKAKKDNQS